ncbi:MAG: hypothetical protein WA821_02365 [Anaerolineales bacterium]
MQTQNSFSAFLILGVLVLIYVAFHLYLVSAAKSIIREYLQPKGITNIDIQSEWFTFDRDTMTFTVEYTMPDGNRRTNRCKLHQWWIFLDNEVFWVEPI